MDNNTDNMDRITINPGTEADPGADPESADWEEEVEDEESGEGLPLAAEPSPCLLYTSPSPRDS